MSCPKCVKLSCPVSPSMEYREDVLWTNQPTLLNQSIIVALPAKSRQTKSSPLFTTVRGTQPTIHIYKTILTIKNQRYRTWCEKIPPYHINSRCPSSPLPLCARSRRTELVRPTLQISQIRYKRANRILRYKPKYRAEVLPITVTEGRKHSQLRMLVKLFTCSPGVS